MTILAVIIVMSCMVTVRGDSLCHNQFMKSIQYQLKLFGDQSCSGHSQHERRRRIGFSATSSKDQTNVAKDSVVVFDRVLMNDGNSYNPQNGTFTAPVEGLYQFSWTITTDSEQNFITFLEMNGQEMGRNHAGSNGILANSASQTIALHLKTGDKVNIKTCFKGQYMYGGPWSIFTGVHIA